eukprot:2066119-Rhodomonas_salina.2
MPRESRARVCSEPAVVCLFWSVQVIGVAKTWIDHPMIAEMACWALANMAAAGGKPADYIVKKEGPQAVTLHLAVSPLSCCVSLCVGCRVPWGVCRVSGAEALIPPLLSLLSLVPLSSLSHSLNAHACTNHVAGQRRRA